MTENLKRKFIWVLMTIMILQTWVVSPLISHAASPGDVVINEVSWSGSPDGSNDEWIELYNNSTQAIDLTGWTIEDDVTSIYTIESGSIPAKGYFLIEDSEESTSIPGDAIISISLANTGDSLVLKDELGTSIDTVNGSGSAWYAGESSSNATMERIDPQNSTDSADNWATAVSGNGATGRSGSAILGTPGSINSNYAGSGPSVSLIASDSTPATGDTITVSAELADMNDIYSYGFEIIYDPTVITYVSAQEGSILNSDGTTTAFNSALEDDQEGVLLVANSRLISPPQGVDGNGSLFTLTFNVIGATDSQTDISSGASSFISDSNGDVPASMNAENIVVTSSTIEPISNLQVNEGSERYSLELTWDPPASGADNYIIYRKAPDGSFVEIGQSTSSSFIDDDNTTNGGNIIPNIQYEYQVVAVSGGNYSSGVNAFGTETRGLTGDNDRSDRVDGRDLDRLARAYGTSIGDPNFDPLLDTTYDGIIDGSDLIDIGANFAKTY